jgi:2-polyprenyl-6-methoxyphenol hydroxylase-like FAD-dependent oxidoreductase
MLFQLASDEGVSISFSTSATGVHTSADDAIVTLDNGQTLAADFLVVADGYDSELRTLVTGIDDDDDRISQQKHLAVAFMLPVDLVCRDEELRPLMNPAHVCFPIFLSVYPLLISEYIYSGHYGLGLAMFFMDLL